MKYLVIVLAVLSLTACQPGDSKKRAEIRYKIFNNCLEMASKIQRQGDDDVSDIVQECGDQADYMTNWDLPDIE